MGLIKGIIGTAAVVLAGAAVVGKVSQEKKKQAELDEFLIPSEEEPVVHNILLDTELTVAIQQVRDKGAEKAVFSFNVENAETAHTLQEQAALAHMGSSYNEEENIVDVIYQNDVADENLDSLNELANIEGVSFKEATSEE